MLSKCLHGYLPWKLLPAPARSTHGISRFSTLVNANKQVRISGWLMYDFQHVPEIGTERATVWEVHPITRIEVADGNGGWQDIEQKPN
jgi:hypothetical protein